MRLIDADALKASIPETEKDIFENCQMCTTLMDYEVKDLINKQPTIPAPRWVRCEERLPEKNGAYLVFIGYGDNWIWFKDIYKDGKFIADTCALNGAKVTHWMPIEPPKEDA